MNMTGDPNQQNRPNVFGEDYNYPNPTVDWNRFTGSANCYSQPNFPFTSNFGNGPVTFPIHDEKPGSSGYFNNAYNPLVYPSTSQYSFGSRSTNFGCKRKTESPPNSVMIHKPSRIYFRGQCNLTMQRRTTRRYPGRSPYSILTAGPNETRPTVSKQHITEEKMAEHLAKLHISSETAATNEPEEFRTKRLYMCEEMRKLQTESILPSSLLCKIQRPCTALVLWQPPQRLVPAENDTVDNNNEEQVPDNNLMETDGR